MRLLLLSWCLLLTLVSASGHGQDGHCEDKLSVSADTIDGRCRQRKSQRIYTVTCRLHAHAHAHADHKCVHAHIQYLTLAINTSHSLTHSIWDVAHSRA